MERQRSRLIKTTKEALDTNKNLSLQPYMRKMQMKPLKITILVLLCFSFVLSANAQDTTKVRNVVVDYNSPKVYTIGGIEIKGTIAYSHEQIIGITGLSIGDKITVPSDDLASVVKRIWLQRIFADVGVYIDSLSNDQAYISIELQERPRISKWVLKGIKKGEVTALEEKLKIRRGSELSDYLISTSKDIVKQFYADKGFLKAEVDIQYESDTLIRNAVVLNFVINKNEKVKIQKINFEGNDNIKSRKLAAAMKKTKDMRRILNVISSKKFNEKEFENDKKLLVEAYNEKGYRDASVLKDSIYYINPSRMGIDIKMEEGQKYYFRDITWTGNSLYSAEQLNNTLRIEKGDVYDMVSMNERLLSARDINVSKMYTDRGYLFFKVIPLEKRIEGDSVDVEMRMVEGKPATVSKVSINGNNVTNDYIVRREILVRPGRLYSQTALETTIQRLAATKYFEEEKLMSYGEGFDLITDPISSSVEVSFNVTERSTSEIEIAGGWSGVYFVGTLGLNLNNFSSKRLFEKKAWKPIPMGDGQTLSLRFQTNGTFYTAMSASFMEPWLFGNKPTSLSVSAYYTRQTNSVMFLGYLNDDQSMDVYGVAAGVGTRLKWPDDNFMLYNELSAQVYNLRDWQGWFVFSNGHSTNLSWKIMLQRNTTAPFFPRNGSDFQFGVQLTPPYSAFRDKNTDYKSMSDSERYRWIEYHKWTFKGSLYTTIIPPNLVLMTRANFGYLGRYNKDLGYSPFEGYMLGGDGMSGYDMRGSEIIGLRGYKNHSLTPTDPVKGNYMGNVYAKYTVELRYPLVMQGQTNIYALLFLEGGNSWRDIKDFNPFSIKRSAGAGVRVTLPMIGMLGIDWGYGFDHDASGTKGKGNVHFVIGQQF